MGAGAGLVKFRRAGCGIGVGWRIVQNLPADNAADLLPELPRKVLHQPVMGFFVHVVLAGVVIAVQKPRHHQHPADRTADLPHPPHAAAEGGRQLRREALFKPRYVAEGLQHRLGAVAVG